MNWKWIYLLSFICVVGLLLYFSGTQDEARGNSVTRNGQSHLEGVKDGRSSDHVQAPDFTLESLTGRKLSLSGFRGRYVLLNMWASWCGPCKQEAPHLVQIDQAFQDTQLMVIGVNMTSQELNLSDVRAFVEKHNFSFPILLDKDGSVMDLYHVIGIPTTYLLDPKGRVIQKFRGVITLEKITETLDGKVAK
ncbi:MAG TPA: TlpA disulfide reductase family protein [Bacillales bacterium]|nr:TlpA disulfide reductase family protein [Bacillales bacterium]